MRFLALFSAVCVALTTAACGASEGGGSAPKTGIAGPRELPWDDIGPDPTPTPAGPIYLKDLSTPGGTPEISSGKCLGFTLVANDPAISWSPETAVSIGPFENVETMLMDANNLRIGAAANAYTCFYTPLFGEGGDWDVVIETGAERHVLAGAIKVRPTKSFDVGRVDVLDPTQWSMDRVTDPEANVFEVPYDIDIYKVDFHQPGTSHTFAHTQFFPTGAVAILPIMEFRESAHPLELTARGGYGLVFPKRGVNYIVVRDTLGQGGPGATYELAFATQTADTASGSATCGTAPDLPPGTYRADYDSLTNNFDSEGACRDSIYNLPMRTPGNDVAFRVRVPAGKQLRVATYDDNIDNALYLLSASSGTCPSRPTSCVRASSRFGGGNTDTLIYDNTSAAEEEFFLIHDSATVMTSGVGSFFFDVEIYDRH